MFSDHSGIKLEIINKQKTWKSLPGVDIVKTLVFGRRFKEESKELYHSTWSSAEIF